MFLYKVYEPSPALKPFVSNYAIVENTEPLLHHILLKAALVLTIQYSGSMELSGEDASVYERYSSGLMGVQHAYRTIRKAANTGVLFINFTEAGAAAFFKVPLHELSNAGFSLDLLLPASVVQRLEEQVALVSSADERVRVAESFLLSFLSNQKQDLLILAAIDAIRQSRGLIKAEELAKLLCISASRLEKRFRQAVGISPKKFASMVRIETVLKSYRAGSPLTKLTYEAGYFDQAHFNRDIKSYTGMPPKLLFSSLATVAGNTQQPCGFIYGSNIPPGSTDEL